MVSLFLISVLMTAPSVSMPRAEMRIGRAIQPIAKLKIVFPDTPAGRRYGASYKAHAKKNDIPVFMFGGGYAIGRFRNGIAVETKLSGDQILPSRVPVARVGNHLVLHFDWCRGPPPRRSSSGFLVPSSQIMLSVVQWLIHDIPDANYQVSFQGTDIGTCPTTQ